MPAQTRIIHYYVCLGAAGGKEWKVNMNKLHLAQLPTPIEKIDYLSNKYKPNIFVKRDDLTDSVASGNKIRKLEYTLILV